MWTDITSWIADKTAGLRILAADFNIVLGYIKTIYDNLVYLKNLVLSFESPVVGKSLKLLDAYVPISPSHPWLCMSLPDMTLAVANYSADFIAERRSRKIVYDELNTNVSSFAGTWSGNVFTLTNNAANNAMIAELAEDWLFAGSPTSNWRILSDDTNEFNITGISASARTITVNLDSKTVSGTSISIYLYRVYGSTTSCRHFSWAGLGLYMTGQNKITGLRRRDKMQLITGSATHSGSSLGLLRRITGPAVVSGALKVGPNTSYSLTGETAVAGTALGFDSSLSPDARTSSKTEMESATSMLYLYVGAYAI